MMLGWFTLGPEAAPGAADRLLAEQAARLQEAGVALAGAVQRNIDRGAECACDMDVLIIGQEDRPIRISQSLGPGSTGCRLDAGALELAAGRVATVLDGAELVIVPKFGRQEAMGRGFRALIGQALAGDLPVLIYVPTEQLAAFASFSGGMARQVAPDGIDAWCREALAGRVA